ARVMFAQDAPPKSTGEGQLPAPPKKLFAPKTSGAGAVSYIEIPGIGFQPVIGGEGVDGNGLMDRYTTNYAGLCFNAPLQLPSGAQIVYLELDFIDTNPGGPVVGSLITCDYTGSNCVEYPTAGAGPPDCRGAGTICSGNAFSGGAGSVSVDLTPD